MSSPLSLNILLREFLQGRKLVPWRLVHDWKCQACGECCRRYVVELTPHEYARITQAYGYSRVKTSMGKLFLRRGPDGTCLFLYRLGDRALCGLQPIKPKACKLWPFQVFEQPPLTHPELSLYRYGRKEFHVFVVPECKGLIYGEPSPRLKEKILPEILEIKLGLRDRQLYSTSQLHPPILTF
mgnify:CR=1 FL=1